MRESSVLSEVAAAACGVAASRRTALDTKTAGDEHGGADTRSNDSSHELTLLRRSRLVWPSHYAHE